jgi:hypothetical protein
MLRFLFTFLLVVMTIGTCNAQFHLFSRNPEKSMFKKTSIGKKEKKVKEPRKVQKARLDQEKKQKQIKKDYAKSVEQNRKRSYDIQTPQVKARMNQDRKDIAARDKAKKRNMKDGSRKAAKKYN